MEQIPAEIYDLIREKSFAELDPETRERVSGFLSPEEYDRLHTLGRGLTDAMREENYPVPDPHVLHELTRAFRSQKRRGFSPLTWKMPVWQAAALLLLVAGAGLFLMKRPDAGLAMLPVRDTVYLATKTPEREVVRDTVYIESAEINKGTRNARISRPAGGGAEGVSGAAAVAGMPPQVPADMPGLKFEDREEPQNGIAVTSMEEDRLREHFGFRRF